MIGGLPLIFLFVCGAFSLSFDMNTNKQAIIGPSDVELGCTFVTGSGDVLNGMHFKVYSDGVYSTIATFSPDDTVSPMFTTDGQYLATRANLTNPTPETNTATLMFHQIVCQDETIYLCEIDYIDGTTGTQPSPLPTVSTNITVKAAAEVPATKPIMSTTGDIAEGENVTFTCFGNVGNPPGRFVWEKYRMIGFFPTIYDDESTVVTQVPDSCTYNGTSSLTITIEDADNNCLIRCEILQEFSSSFQQTAPISIMYSVRGTSIWRIPDQVQYTNDTDHITLSCYAASNPTATFSWYKDGNWLSNTASYIINDVIAENEGDYTCKAENSIKGISYAESVTTTVVIVSGQMTPSSVTVTKPATTGILMFVILTYLLCYN